MQIKKSVINLCTLVLVEGMVLTGATTLQQQGLMRPFSIEAKAAENVGPGFENENPIGPGYEMNVTEEKILAPSDMAALEAMQGPGFDTRYYKTDAKLEESKDTKKEVVPYGTHFAVHVGKRTVVLEPELQNYVYEVCKEFGISGHEKLIIAKLYGESHFNPNCISGKNYGMSQINECNHERLSKKLGITDFLDAKQSIRAGVYMISECLKSNDFNESAALVAYNTGKNGIKESEYSKYILDIKNNMTNLK